MGLKDFEILSSNLEENSCGHLNPVSVKGDERANESLMFEPSTHQPKLLKAWEDFVKTGEIIEGAFPDHITQSWIRSRKASVDPFRFSPQLYLEPSEYKIVIEKGSSLLRLAQPIMENIYNSLERSRYIVVLYNAHGYHLLRIGQRADLERSRNFFIQEGMCFEERCVGTCGFSLVKHHLRPIYISGCEHYSKLLHYVTGAYAPILDPLSQNLIGVIGVTGAKTMPNPHTLSIVVAASTAMEHLINLQRAKHDLSVYTKSLQVAMNSLEDGFFIVNCNGTIFDSNRSSRRIFALGTQDMTGKHISALPQLAAIRDEILSYINKNLTKEVKFDCAIHNKMYLISLSALKYREHIQGVLVQMRNVKEITRAYQALAGYEAKYNIDSILGSSHQIEELKRNILVTTKADGSVIIEGESGTGKEVTAQAIHNLSDRRDRPFVAVNCAAVPHELMESTLFGHEKGSFTGAASSHIGKFELADTGTLFLDEIGEMIPAMQVKLLRAIEERQIERVGGKKPIPVDIRILAASNRSLFSLCEKNKFRKDLYYRIKVFQINVPPLRERMNDIYDMLPYFATEFSTFYNKPAPEVSQSFFDCLFNYDWPGNVREFKNAIHCAVTRMGNDPVLLPKHLDGFCAVKNEISEKEQQNKNSFSIRAVEEKAILDILKTYSGNKSKAAKALGISRATLYRKLAAIGGIH